LLITGIAGFAGSHLAEYLVKENLGEVHGIIRTYNANLDNIKGVLDKVKLHECDLTDAYGTEKVIKDVKPDYVFHLAAQAFVPKSWVAPLETINCNIAGSVNLFEAIRKADIDPKIQIAGTSEEYGLVHPDETPITEKNELRPLSPYGVAKVAMDYYGYQFHESYGLKIVITRGFNHTGPRRGVVYVCSDWSKQIAEIEAGKRKPVMFTGNLEAKRDFTDVKDMVRGYYLAAEKGKPGERYNIGSGKAYAMKEIQQMLFGMTDVKIENSPDPGRMRPSDVPLLLADYSKIKEATGWQPEIPFEQTLEELLNWWRAKIKE
jgi:GDP-4-dehydro-6-deoxy-D-mannose reductase